MNGERVSDVPVYLTILAKTSREELGEWEPKGRSRPPEVRVDKCWCLQGLYQECRVTVSGSPADARKQGGQRSGMNG